MSRILGISGSLRKGSFNTALINTAKQLYPDTIEIGDIRGVPLYDGDLESAGMPETVKRLQQQLAEADGLLLASPEYNNSIPGVLKNTVDWLSRPSDDIRNVFRGKSVAVMGATPGGWGTLLAQNAWLPVFRTLSSRYWTGGRLLISSAHHVFDEHGNMVDEGIRERLEKFVSDFASFTGQDPR